MPRNAKPGMAWLNHVELREEAIKALEAHMNNTGMSRREALEFALSHLPTYPTVTVVAFPDWANELQTKFIDAHQPFVLNYRDAADKSFSWTVRYAEFTRHENRTYLDFWAQETEDNHDLEELRHNWCVRLDRIVSVEPVALPNDIAWLEGLDTIQVEFYLYGGLSYAYAKETDYRKPGDIVSERIDANTRRVVRRISNTFWLLRELMPYGDDCQVIAPIAITSLVLTKLQALALRYGWRLE